jgi:hypothetical protein
LKALGRCILKKRYAVSMRVLKQKCLKTPMNKASSLAFLRS